MTTYQREIAHLVMEDIKPLMRRHWEESGRHKDIPMAPNYKAYLNAEDQGLLRVFTARRDLILLGYMIFFVGSLHYTLNKLAQLDLLYVLPACRGGKVGYSLMRFSEDYLITEGVDLIKHGMGLNHHYGCMLLKMGYEPIETIYEKRCHHA